MSSGKYESHIFWAQPLHHGVWATRKSLFASAIALNTQRIIAIENLKKKSLASAKVHWNVLYVICLLYWTRGQITKQN